MKRLALVVFVVALCGGGCRDKTAPVPPPPGAAAPAADRQGSLAGPRPPAEAGATPEPREAGSKTAGNGNTKVQRFTPASEAFGPDRGSASNNAAASTAALP